MSPLRLLMCIYAVAAAPSAALAHIAADPGSVPAGGYSKAVFRVGHACSAGQTTTKVRIETPAALIAVRAQQVPGWTLAIERDGEKVTAVTWTGRLPDAEFQEFGLFLQTPSAPQTLYFPAVQTCDGGETQWIEIPGPGERAARPAPAIVLTAPAGTAAPAAHEH